MIDWLDYNGFCVVTKPAKEFVDSLGRRKVKGNMDIELAIDALELAPRIDHMILFSATVISAPSWKPSSGAVSGSLSFRPYRPSPR